MNRVLTPLLIAIGLLLAAMLARSGDAAWMALPFLAYLALGIARSPSAGAIRLDATRAVKETSRGATSSVEVALTIRNRGAEMVQVSLSDPLQPGMQVAPENLRQSLVLQAGDSGNLTYTFGSERGDFAWKTVRAVARAPLGLVETVLDLPAEAAIQVRPEPERFRRLALRPRRTLHSSGSIPARLGGSGTDFWGIREYQPGDPLRRLDWRLTARHPRHLFTKEFEQEEIADIGLIVDARRTTDLRVEGSSLFEHSARAAASLAETFLRQGNRVSLLVYGEPPISVYPGYGKVQLNRILSTLARVVPEDDVSFNSLQFVPIHMFSSHSLIVVISPLARDDERLFPRLRAFGYQVLLISPDPIDFAHRALPADNVTRLATRLTRVERQLEIYKITQLWIPVIDWPVDRPLAPLVRHALTHTHIQREH